MKRKFMSLNSAILLLGILLLSSCGKTDNTALYQEIKSVDKMVFASMAITKTAKMESSDWYTMGKVRP